MTGSTAVIAAVTTELADRHAETGPGADELGGKNCRLLDTYQWGSVKEIPQPRSYIHLKEFHRTLNLPGTWFRRPDNQPQESARVAYVD